MEKNISVLDSLPDVSHYNMHLPTKIIDKLTYQNDTDLELMTMLKKLNGGDLISLLNGAEFAINSSNPDYNRHFGSSLRELFNHVIRLLAPNNEVEKWTNDPNHYHDGKPTRRARLLYISRNKNKKFQEYLDKDIKSTLTFIELLNGLNHNLENNLTELELKGMLIRMKGTLYSLLSAKYSN